MDGLVHDQIRDLDALVVGAGFGGIYMLKKLRNEQASSGAIDKAGGVGGTWYWNRYPGALSDTEGFVYSTRGTGNSTRRPRGRSSSWPGRNPRVPRGRGGPPRPP